jgi:hypothetical protein
MNEITPTTAIDCKAIVAQLKELTGKTWADYTYNQQPEFVLREGAVRRSVKLGTNGKWSWEHQTTIGRHASDKYDVSADIKGESDTFEEAVAMAMTFSPEPPREVAGAIWHQGDTFCGRPDQSIALIGKDLARVSPSVGSDQFYWRRSWEPTEALVNALRANGCGYLNISELSGLSETFEAAAEEAAEAPERLKGALKVWLKLEDPTPRELPTGAADHFRQAVLEAPETDAHLAGALGNSRIAPWALAEYLEAVAAQMKSDAAAAQAEG